MMTLNFITKGGQVRLMSLVDILILGHLTKKPKQTAKALVLEGASNCYESVKHRLDKLLEQGYVERQKAKHTTGYEYSLTKSGRDYARQIYKGSSKFFEEVYSILEYGCNVEGVAA